MADADRARVARAAAIAVLTAFIFIVSKNY
jgi:hypothetical protein